MPSTWKVGEDVYDFVEWEDASTNTTRVVSLTENTIITASYALTGPAGHQLAVYSYPINGTRFTVDGVADTTTWTGLLDEGNHTVVMSHVWTNGLYYAFDRWEDASTSLSRIISLTEDTTIVAYYVTATLHDVTIDSDPVSEVEFTFDGMTNITTWSDVAGGGNHTVVAPALWESESVLYAFAGWYDAGDVLLSSDPSVVITLPDDGDYFYAYYEEAVFYDVTIDSDPMSTLLLRLLFGSLSLFSMLLLVGMMPVMSCCRLIRRLLLLCLMMVTTSMLTMKKPSSMM